MGWLGRRVLALTVLLLVAGCVSVPPGTEPNAGRNQADTPVPQGARPGKDPEECEADSRHPKRQMRGAWIASVRNIDWPSKAGLSAKRQRAQLRDQLDRAEELNLTSVFFHVRPTADAMYDSDKEPWARYLTGTQGRDPGYDPLEFAVAEAHRRGLELHAWFNPYRVGWKDSDLDHLVGSHPAKRHPDWLIEYADQGFLDPGNPDVRKWVSDVVLDVVDRYDIDGAHFDDYFYPYPAEGEKFDDDASWKAHRDDFDDRGDWRRHNVTALLSDVHNRINETKPWVRFGVSPFGIWRNSSTDGEGSDTSGLESYDAQYADTRAWIEKGAVDYVAPQLYWPRGFDDADYDELVPWWSDEVAGTGVDLYIGQAAYKVGDKDWKGDDALSRQLDANAEHSEVGGDIYFSMKDLNGRAGKAMDRVADDRYGRPALPPRTDDAPDPPASVRRLEADPSKGEVRLEWDAVKGARSYAVYRVPGRSPDRCDLADAGHLVEVTGARGDGRQRLTDRSPGGDPARYYVTAVDRYRSEGGPSPAAPVNGG